MSKEKVAEVSDASLWKIREMWMSDNKEDYELAAQWLTKLIGEDNAAGNLFVLEFYRDWEDDSDHIIDDDNYWKMKFKTFPISFGKDYRYEVTFEAKLNGELIVNFAKDYSRYRVGNGEPKMDFCEYVYDAMRRKGYEFYDGLFHNKTIQS